MTRWTTVVISLFIIVSSVAAQDTGFTGDVTTATGTNVFNAHIAYVTSTGDTVAQTMTDSAGHYSLAVSPTGVADHCAVPMTVHLGQNYPNSFNPSTNIIYNLPENTKVTTTHL